MRKWIGLTTMFVLLVFAAIIVQFVPRRSAGEGEEGR